MRRTLTVFVLASVLVLVFSGCVWLKDKTRTSPASVDLAQQKEVTWTYKEGVWLPVTSESKKASAVGPSISTSQDGGTQDFDATCPEVTLNGLTGTGGGVGFSVKNAWQKVLQGPGLMVIGGIVLILGAGVLYFVTKDIRTAAVVGTGGLIVCAAGVLFEAYPWVLLLAGIAGVGLVGYFVYQTYLKKYLEAESVRQSVTNAVLVRAIEANPEAKAVITAAIPTIAGSARDEVKATITKVKIDERI